MIEEKEQENVYLVGLIEKEKIRLETLQSTLERMRERNAEEEQKLRLLISLYDEKFKELN